MRFGKTAQKLGLVTLGMVVLMSCCAGQSLMEMVSIDNGPKERKWAALAASLTIGIAVGLFWKYKINKKSGPPNNIV